MDHYAVIGSPIAHSKSPQIHAEFATKTQQEMVYDAIEVLPDDLLSFLPRFFAEASNCGLNVTVPHKEAVCTWVDHLSDRAQLAGAANTLYRDQAGKVCADNTDGVGLVTDLVVNHGVTIKGKRLLLLGAGGAVRGVLGPLLSESPLEVVIANRTAPKAYDLADQFSDIGKISGLEFKDLGPAFDIIINGTSASLGGAVPNIPAHVIGSQTIAYDMMYAKEMTPFNTFCMAHGASRVMDGLGMLVEQAAEAFRIWRGVRPDTSQLMIRLR